jgi:hypothetical protein
MGVIGFAGSLCGPSGLSVRTVLFDHFVVISQNQEGCGPLTDKKRPVILLGNFENQSAAIDPIASPRNRLEGALEVWRSMAPVNLSSVD